MNEIMINYGSPKDPSVAQAIPKSAFSELGKKLSLQWQKVTSQNRCSKDGVNVVSFQSNPFKNRPTKSFLNNKQHVQTSSLENVNRGQLEHDFGYNYHGLSNNQVGLNVNKPGVYGAEPCFDNQASAYSTCSFGSNLTDLPWLKHKMSLWRKKQNLQDKRSSDGILMISLQKNTFKKSCKWTDLNYANTKKSCKWSDLNYVNTVQSAGNYQQPAFYNYRSGNYYNDDEDYCKFYPTDRVNKHIYFSDTHSLETNGSYGESGLNSKENIYENREKEAEHPTVTSDSSCDATTVGQSEPDVIFEKMVSAEEKRVLAVVTITSDNETDDSPSKDCDLKCQTTNCEEVKNSVPTNLVDSDESLLNQTANDLEKTLGFCPPKLHLLGLNPTCEDQQKLVIAGYVIRKGRYMEDEDSILLENLKFLQEFLYLDLYDVLLGNRRRKYLQQIFAETHFYIRLGKNLDNRTLHSAYKRAGSLLLIQQKIKELNAEFLSMKAGSRKMTPTLETPNPKSKGTWTDAEKVQLLKAMDALLNRKRVRFTIQDSFWSEIAVGVPSRTAKQCKNRWFQFHSFNFKLTLK